jgi:hypothetical protein
MTLKVWIDQCETLRELLSQALQSLHMQSDGIEQYNNEWVSYYELMILLVP